MTAHSRRTWTVPRAAGEPPLIALGEGAKDIDFDSWIADRPDTRPDVTYAMDDVVAVRRPAARPGCRRV